LPPTNGFDIDAIYLSTRKKTLPTKMRSTSEERRNNNILERILVKTATVITFLYQK
jgi:hypothetical protein